MTTVEPEWDAEARAMALALTEWEQGLCPGCRYPLEETTAAGNEERYFTHPAVRCHRCTATDQASKVYQESPSPGALLIPVEFRPPPKPAAEGR